MESWSVGAPLSPCEGEREEDEEENEDEEE